MDTIDNLSERLTHLEFEMPKVTRKLKIVQRAIRILLEEDSREFDDFVALTNLTEKIGKLQIQGLQQPGDSMEEGYVQTLEAKLEVKEDQLYFLQEEAGIYWCAIMEYPDGGKQALEEAEKQVIAEEEIAAGQA